MKTTTWKNMYKIIFIFKENIAFLLVPFAILSLILAAVLASASAQDVPTKTSICKEVGQGKYQNLAELLKPNSSLSDIKLNNNGEPIYTKQQNEELMTLNAECGVRVMPFFGLFISAIEDIENIYTKYFKS
jgi:hypothetical protein